MVQKQHLKAEAERFTNALQAYNMNEYKHLIKTD